MTLKQIEVFLAVADTCSFSKGGELVSLAQSTASQHIRALEDELGTRLFDRSASQVAMTSAGKLFYLHAKSICSSCEEAKGAVRRFMNLEKAVLRVGASTIPAAFMIPDLLGTFSERLPGVSLELLQGDSRAVIRDLVDAEVELAIVGGMFDSDLVSFNPVASERIILVCRSGNNVPCSIVPDELYNIPLVVREEGSGTRQSVDGAVIRTGLNPRKLRIKAQLGSSEAVRRAVLGGAGFAFISSLAVRRELEEGVLREVHVEGLEIQRDFYMGVQRGRTLSPAASVFIEMLKENWG